MDHLLNAKSASVVEQSLVECFRCRHEGLPAYLKDVWMNNYAIKSHEDVDVLFVALRKLIRAALRLSDSTTSAPIDGIFGEDFHANLKGLLSKLLLKHLAAWKAACVQSMVSPPRLVDFDWRVDIKSSSNQLSRMAVPTVMVEMQLQHPPQRRDEMSGVQSVQFELSKETLSTMLDGLSKIRDQLSGLKDI